jgi:protein subunit release factor A
MSASEKIIMRKGDSRKRAAAQQALTEVGILKSAYRVCKSKLEELEEKLQHERDCQNRATDELIAAQGELAQVEEVIDSDLLPEAAQPNSRIKSRDKLLLVGFVAFLPI